MDTVLLVGKWLFEHWQDLLAAVVAVLTALVGLFLLVPGPHPEDWLRAAVDFLVKFSRKPPPPAA